MRESENFIISISTGAYFLLFILSIYLTYALFSFIKSVIQAIKYEKAIKKYEKAKRAIIGKLWAAGVERIYLSNTEMPINVLQAVENHIEHGRDFKVKFVPRENNQEQSISIIPIEEWEKRYGVALKMLKEKMDPADVVHVNWDKVSDMIYDQINDCINSGKNFDVHFVRELSHDEFDDSFSDFPSSHLVIDIEQTIFITPEKSVPEKSVVNDICADCRGTGSVYVYNPDCTCYQCYGACGNYKTCPQCHGLGH